MSLARIDHRLPDGSTGKGRKPMLEAEARRKVAKLVHRHGEGSHWVVVDDLEGAGSPAGPRDDTEEGS